MCALGRYLVGWWCGACRGQCRGAGVGSNAGGEFSGAGVVRAFVGTAKMARCGGGRRDVGAVRQPKLNDE